MHQISYLLLVSFFIVSCQGQHNTESPTAIAGALHISPGTPPAVSQTAYAGPYTGTRCGLEDKTGSLWFCTIGAGIYRYQGTKFTHFTNKDGLSNNIVYSMLEDHTGTTWFATNDGVCYYNGQHFSRFRIPGVDNDNYYFATSTYGTRRANAKPVISMIQDKKGHFWFGTERMGLYRYDGISFTNFAYNNITCMLEDKSGNLWFSSTTSGGVYRYNGRDFVHFTPEERIKSPVAYMLEDTKGNLWFGTQHDGVYRYDGQSFTYFTEKEGLGSNNTTCIFEDKTGNTWFAGTTTGAAGQKTGCITRYDGKQFTPFAGKEVNNSAIWNILEDNAGNLWFGSKNAGLYRYDGKNFTNFSDEAAIKELQENPGGC